jgi:hypothetical protein
MESRNRSLRLLRSRMVFRGPKASLVLECVCRSPFSLDRDAVVGKPTICARRSSNEEGIVGFLDADIPS